MTTYLDFDTVLAINLENGGPGAGVREREGVEAAIGRPYSSGFGEDLFPTLWDKAAVYLHGLCSTQYFHDGNKRTAWLVAITFLALNGIDIPKVPDVEAEAFVLCVAKELFTNEDEPDRTVEMAAEWFRVKYENRRPGPASDRRFEYVFLAAGAHMEDGIFDVAGGGLIAGSCSEFPSQTELVLVGRVHWDEEDAAQPHVLTALSLIHI